MDQEKALEILKKDINITVGENFIGFDNPYFSFGFNDDHACFDGDFTTEQVEAILWVMKNKEKIKSLWQKHQ